MILLGFFSTLFGCGGGGKPGFFSSNGYHTGKEKVWYKSSTGMSFNVSEVEGADAQTFAEREWSSKSFPGSTAFYGMDKQNVFWAGSKIEGADLATFEYLCGNYSRDKNAVFYMANRLTEDVAHFAVLDWQLVKDGSHVYYGGNILSDDPAHFTRVGEEPSKYYKDSQKCWYDVYELKDASPATLRYLGPGTAADAKHIYFEMNAVEGADQKTYQILENEYSKDAHSVYLKGLPIAGADPASFRLLGGKYALDNKYCYLYTTPLQNADPATFKLIDDFYAKDAQRVYCNGNVMEGADPATFRVLNSSGACSCDAHHAYVLERRIEGVDPKNFPANKECKSCNESGVTF